MTSSKKWTVIIAWLSSGIGAGFAREYAEQWYNLFLVAKDRKELAIFVKYLKVLYPIEISSMVFDAAKKEQHSKLYNTIKNISDIKILVNCIGYTSDKKIKKRKLSQRKDIITPYDEAANTLSHETLNLMKKKKEGTLIHVSSLASLLAIWGDPITATSKIFLNKPSETLHDLYTSYNISLQTLCPRFTDIDFGDVPFKERATAVTHIIRTSLAYKQQGKLVCIPAWYNKIILTLYHLLPRSWSYSIFKWFIR